MPMMPAHVCLECVPACLGCLFMLPLQKEEVLSPRMHAGQEHTMRWRPSRYTPCSPLHGTGTCAVEILNLTCDVHLSLVSGLPSSK